MCHKWFSHNFTKLGVYFLCAKKTKISTLINNSSPPRHLGAILECIKYVNNVCTQIYCVRSDQGVKNVSACICTYTKKKIYGPTIHILVTISNFESTVCQLILLTLTQKLFTNTLMRVSWHVVVKLLIINWISKGDHQNKVQIKNKFTMFKLTEMSVELLTLSLYTIRTVLL